MDNRPRHILHVATAAEWEAQQAAPAYAPGAFAREGFVHCCEEGQLAGVLERYFSGRGDLVVLVLDRERLGARVVWENLLGGEELFPHVYGKIEREAIVEARARGEGTRVNPDTLGWRGDGRGHNGMPCIAPQARCTGCADLVGKSSGAAHAPGASVRATAPPAAPRRPAAARASRSAAARCGTSCRGPSRCR